jgi:AAA family ATP:ADP antiporter
METESPARDEARAPIAILRPIAEVRRGEVLPLFASLLWIFFALNAYYIIKPIRSTVLQTQIGVDNKPIALLATTAFVGIFVFVYGRIVERVARTKLIVATFIIFVICLSAFAVLLPLGGTVLGYVFYVWVSTFNLMIVSQFWALAADVWTKEEGARLFGFIGVGGVLGSISGTLIVRMTKQLNAYEKLFISVGLLVACTLLALYILRFAASKAKAQKKETVEASASPPDAPAGNPAKLVVGSAYLGAVALMMLVLNIVNSNNEWIMDKVLSGEGLDEAAITAWYADYYLYQNVITFLIQLFVTSRVQRRFGAKVALLFEPTIGIVGGLAFIAAPVLSVIRWHKILENSADYSIQSNTRELLYLPVTRLEKYSAKNFNDTFIVRGGDALAAGSIYLATSVLMPAFGADGLKVLIGANVVLGVVWIFIALRIGRMHAERMRATGTRPPVAA